jgi:thioredoxin-like negative regulator of GroEL
LVGGVPCHTTTWVSDNKLQCVVPAEGAAGASGEFDSDCVSVQVRVGPGPEQISKVNSKWRYEHQGASKKSHSVQLTPANVDQVINGDRPVLVKLCSPSCDHCKKLQHPWNEVARLMKCKNMVVATVRGDRFPQLLERFQVDEYPRVVWIPEGMTTPTKEYTGVFSAERIVGWIARQFGHANKLWSPLEDGNAGPDWESTTTKSPLLIGTGLPPASKKCKAAAIAAASEEDVSAAAKVAPAGESAAPPTEEAVPALATEETAAPATRRFFFF